MEQKRLLSLDAFRGFTIAAMILVNNPGSWSSIYAPLRHATWNGITPTDLIFPFFLFIVGVSIALAYSKYRNGLTAPRNVTQKQVFRAIKIFAVGLFLNLYPDFDFGDMRIAGVLQRIAVLFLVCAPLFLKTGWKTQAIIGACLLMGYWLAMTLIPTPGYETALLDPGTNLAAWVDSQWLPGKLWNQTWDPEGILSTLPAMATTIGGMLTGRFLLCQNSREQKVIYLLMGGFVLTLLGLAWGWIFPINKNLWTSSYVLFTEGLALLALGSLVFVVDCKGYQKWTHWGIVFGSNAIAIYVLSNLLAPVFYGINLGGNSLNNHYMDLLIKNLGLTPEFASFTYALMFVAVNFVPACLLYKRKIFIKL
jgi:predicted acyltransferase